MILEVAEKFHTLFLSFVDPVRSRYPSVQFKAKHIIHSCFDDLGSALSLAVILHIDIVESFAVLVLRALGNVNSTSR